MFKKIITSIMLTSIILFVGAISVSAGSLTPPGTPANTMYTMTDIFNLSAGTTATLGSGTIQTTPGSVVATYKTLTEIYDAIAAQVAALANGKIASGISAFGSTGTLYGDTNAAKVLDTATYPGTIAVKTGDTVIASSSAQSTSLVLTVPQGYYSGASSVTVSTSSASFTAGNIKSGTTIFGTLGTLVANLYGDLTDAAKVLTTASSAGTYNAANLSAGTVLAGTTFGVAETGTVIQSLGNAVAGNVISGTTFSNASGANISGTMPVKTADNAVTGGTVSGTSLLLTPPTGYYDGSATVSTTSDAFIAGNIKSGTTLFGILGTLVANLYGDLSDATKALTTASSPGTYNATNLSVGTVKSGTAFAVASTGDYPSTTYPLSGDTGATDASAGSVLNGQEAWTKAGTLMTGTIPVKTADNAVTGGTVSGTSLLLTPPTGYYDGSATVSTTSDAFIAGNIANGVTLFGITGTLSSLDTSDATAVVSDILSPKTAYVNGSKITGTISTNTLSTANDTVSAGYYAATTLSAVDTDLAVGNIKSGVNIFGKVGTALGAQLIKTNQTICYDAAGGVVACAGTGQDGEYLKGATRSYTDNADSTITDNNTGLTWEKCSEGLSGASCGTGTATTYTWVNALAQCEGSTANGHSDWRLPNVYEMYSLIDFGVASAPFVNATYFPATQSNDYWSSTTYPASYTFAMSVNFYNGLAGFNGKASSLYVRCVRG